MSKIREASAAVGALVSVALAGLALAIVARPPATEEWAAWVAEAALYAVFLLLLACVLIRALKGG